jgi:hypothetical protein
MSKELEVKPFPGKGFESAPEDRGWIPLTVPTQLNVNTVKLVRDFSEALMQKLLKAQTKYGHQDGWMDGGWMDKCRADMMDHIEKGDPLDVAAYTAFLWFHGESTVKRNEEYKE